MFSESNPTNKSSLASSSRQLNVNSFQISVRLRYLHYCTMRVPVNLINKMKVKLNNFPWKY